MGQEEKGEAGEDSEEVGEDSVEATTEERAVLNSAITSPSASTKFSNLPKSSSFLRLHRLKFFFFIFINSSLENSALWQDQSYKITRVKILRFLSSLTRAYSRLSPPNFIIV